MLGKSDGEQLKGKAPHFLSWRRSSSRLRSMMVAHHGVDFWLRPRTCRSPTTDSPSATTAR